MSGDDHKELARFVSHLAMLALHLDSGNPADNSGVPRQCSFLSAPPAVSAVI